MQKGAEVIEGKINGHIVSTAVRSREKSLPLDE